MENQASSPSVREIEDFWAESTDALEPSTGHLPGTPFTCCAGVDLPGVGYEHHADCPSRRAPVRSGSPYVAGEVPQPLRDFVGGDSKRDALVCELLFASRQLAINAIRNYKISEKVSFLLCRECSSASVEGPVVHWKKCRVGRVLRALDQLQNGGAQ